MAEDFLQVPPDSTGSKMRTVSQTIGANAVEQETVVIGDATTARVAGVTAAGELNVAGTVTVANPTTSPETGLAKDATLAAQGTALGTDASLQAILTALTTAAAQAATTAAVDAVANSLVRQATMNPPPRALPYSRATADDSMRVTVQNASVTTSLASTIVSQLQVVTWGNNGTNPSWYQNGGPMSMDSREQQRELSQQTFNQVRTARWVIT